MLKAFYCYVGLTAALLFCFLGNGLAIEKKCKEQLKYKRFDHKVTYVASIRKGVMHRGKNEHHVCTGTILSNKMVLTTAECITSLGPPWMQLLYVVAGTAFRSSESLYSQYAEVAKIRVHEKYKKPKNTDNDIALLYLRSYLWLGCAANPVKVASNSAEEGPYSMIGWEKLSGEYQDVLTSVTLTKGSNETCAASTNGSANLFCASYEKSTPSCIIEMGSPVVIKADMYGMAIRNFSCNNSAVLVFINVQHYADWITQGATIPIINALLYTLPVVVLFVLPNVCPFG